jgi:hypothetical protein
MTTINQPWSPIPAIICDFGWYATSDDSLFLYNHYKVNSYTYPPYANVAPYNVDPRYMVYTTPLNQAVTFDAGTATVVGLGLPYCIVPSNLSILSYSWDLGNGSFAIGPTVSGVVYTIQSPDTAVTLTVIDSLGRRSQTVHNINLQSLVKIYPSGSEIRQGPYRPS